MPDASLYSVGQRQKRMSINASYNIYYDCMYVSVCIVCKSMYVRTCVCLRNRVLLIYIVTFGNAKRITEYN